jgi:hypothetical protein
MHSTGEGPSFGGCGSKMPGMWQPLSRIQFVFVLHVLFDVERIW